MPHASKWGRGFSHQRRKTIKAKMAVTALLITDSSNGRDKDCILNKLSIDQQGYVNFSANTQTMPIPSTTLKLTSDNPVP